MRLITPFLLLLVLLATQTFAQDSTLIISQPVELSKEGINKVLQLSTGNTMLFHFENKRHIRVKVFDSKGKEIASTVPELKIVDMNLLDITYLDGLIECNGDAALFLTQDIGNTETMMRILFDGKTGRLKKEESIVESASFKNNTSAQLLAKPDGSFSLVCLNNSPDEDTMTLEVRRYNIKHEVYEVLGYKHKKIHGHYYGASSRSTPKGDVLVSIVDIEDGNIGDIKTNIQLMYLRNDLHDFVVRSFKIPDNVQLEGLTFTRNEFAGNLNVVFILINKMYAFNGLEAKRYRKQEQLLMIMPEDMSTVNTLAFNSLKGVDSITNLHSSFELINVRTNDRGLTLASHLDKDPQLKFNGNFWDVFKRFIVSKYDDNGTLLSSVSIPCYHKFAIDGTPGLFGRLIDKKAAFMFDEVVADNAVYFVYNDISANEKVMNLNDVTVVTDFDSTDAMICHVSKKNILTKKWLVKKLDSNEHIQVLALSSHYFEKTKTYSAIIRRKKGKQETFHVAWRRLED